MKSVLFLASLFIGFALLSSLTLAETVTVPYQDKAIKIEIDGSAISCSFLVPTETKKVCETVTIPKPREQWAYWEEINFVLNGIAPYPITETRCRDVPVIPPITPPNNTTNTTNNSIRYTVYTTSSAQETIDVLKKHFVNPPSENYLFEDSDERQITQQFDHDFNFIIGSSTYQHIIDVKFDQAREEIDADGNDIINLDDEKTLNVEIYNSNIVKSSEAVRGHGYKFGLTPSGDYIMKNYQTIDWTKIDWFGIQLQRFSKDEDSAYFWSKKISEYAKSKNPNIEIFTQVSLRQAESIPELETTLLKLSNITTNDGFIVTYMPDDETNSPTHVCPSSLCNGANLDRVLTFIEKL